MVRSTFFAIGLFVTLWGLSFLTIDKLVLNRTTETAQTQRQSGMRGMFGMTTTTNAAQQKVVDPPDWVAFSLMSVGTVTMLYSVALPKKKEGH